jgi:hypothetical protein
MARIVLRFSEFLPAVLDLEPFAASNKGGAAYGERGDGETAMNLDWMDGSGDFANAGSWSPAQAPTASDDATIAAPGTYTVTIGETDAVHSLTVDAAGATVADNGELDLTGAGASLSVGAGVFQLNGNGVIKGGVLSASGSGAFAWNGGTLDGVAFEGTLDLSASGASLTIKGPTTFAGAGGVGSATINLAGYASVLYVHGDATLDNATINLGGGTNYFGGGAQLYNEDTAGTGAVLTLGSNLTIDHMIYYAELLSSDKTGDAIINDGTINADLAGGLFVIDGTNFTNNGTITVSNGDTLDLIGAVSATLINSIQNSGGTVEIGGTVTGGTIDGPEVSAAGGTLDGVAFEGTLDISAGNSSLTIEGATTLSGTGGVGLATINITAYRDTSTLYVSGTGTLDNATINIGQDNPYDGPNQIYNEDTAGMGAILTLGSNLTINQTGLYADLASSDKTGDGIINNATINANYAGGIFYIDATNFTNNGTITVSNGDILDLTGTVSAALVSSIQNSGGTIAIGGTVTGGTITAPNGGVGGAGGVLDGVAFQGTLDLSAPRSTLTIKNGTTFAGVGGVGPATINITSDNHDPSTLNVSGTATLDNATIDIGQSNPYSGSNQIWNKDAAGTGAVLTLGSNLTIDQTGAFADLLSSDQSADAIVNYGTINANYAGGEFVIDATNFTNNGTITVSNGDTIALIGAVSAALINSIQISGGTVAIGGTVTGGTITAPNGGVGGAGGVLDGVAFQGTLDLSAPGSTLTIKDGTTFAGTAGVGPATINIASNNHDTSTLYVSGNETLDNATIDIGESNPYSGANEIWNKDIDGTGAVLTLGSSLTIDQTGTFADLLSSDQSGDAIVNDGTIDVGYAGGVFVIDANSFTNNGTITVSNGDTLTIQAGVFQLNAGGVIKGGVLSDPSGVFDWNGGLLDGVTYWGPLNLETPGQYLFIKDGLTLAGAGGVGPGELDLGASNAIYLIDSQTIDNAVINMGAGSAFSGTVDSLGAILSGTGYQEQFITFGPHLTIEADSGFGIFFFDNGDGPLGVINQGTINQGGAYSSVTADSFDNQGTITAGASYFEFYTKFSNSGTLKGTGGIVDFDPGFSVTNTGVISIQGGGLGFYSPDVINTGTITVDSGGVNLDVGPTSQYGDLKITNSSVDITGALTTAQLVSWAGGGGDYISLAADLDNTGAVFGATASEQFYAFTVGTSTQVGTITGGVLAGNGGDTVTLNAVFDGVAIRGQMGIAGPTEVINGVTFAGGDGAGRGGVRIFDNGTFDIIDSLTLDNVDFSLTGVNATVALDISQSELSANNGATLPETLTLGAGASIVQNGASGVLGAGATELGAVDLVNDGLIESDAGPLTLRGLSGVQNAGAMLAQTGGSIFVQGATLANTGSITVDAGSTFAAQSIDNSATITLAGGTLDAANLTGSGKIVGYGVLNIASGAAGAVEASGGELDVYDAGPLTSLTVDAGATLVLENPSAASVTAAGAGVLKLEQPLTYTGTISALNGAALNGAVIDLVGLTATGPAVIVGSTVQIQTSGGLVTLNLAGSPPGAFTVQSDGAGGTDLTYVDGNVYTATYGNVTIVQRFATSGQQTTAQITSVYGADTYVQNFDGNWVQTSANVTQTFADGSIVQNFDANWNQTSAVFTLQPDANTTIVQHFDGSWTQTGATLTQIMGDVTQVQTFNANWVQTGATRTTAGADGGMEVQTFDGNWNQTGATITRTLGNGAVEVQDFNGGWTQIDANITTSLGAGASQQAFFTGSWGLTSIVDTLADGFKTYTDYGVTPSETFTAAADHATTFVFTPGTLDGDTLNGLHTFGAMSALHDVIDFQGYGPGAALAQVDPTHWRITSTNNPAETFAVSAGTTLAAGDYVFT